MEIGWKNLAQRGNVFVVWMLVCNTFERLYPERVQHIIGNAGRKKSDEAICTTLYYAFLFMSGNRVIH